MAPQLRSKVVWVKGQENYIITLDSHGKALLHGVFHDSSTSTLSKPSEKVVKMSLGSSFLYMLIKKPASPFMICYKLPTSSLVTFSPIRIKILQSLKALLGEIEEIDAEFLKISVKTSEFLEVWNLDTGEKDASVALLGRLDAKYNRGKLIALFQDGANLRVLINDLVKFSIFNLVVLNGIMPYFYEFLNEKLVLCMRNRGVMVLKCGNNSVETCNLSNCVRYYEMEHANDAFLLLDGGKGFFLSNPEKLIQCGVISDIFANTKENLIVYSGERKGIKVISSEEDVAEEFSVVGIKDISVIGTNKDSQQIYVANTCGRISVFE